MQLTLEKLFLHVEAFPFFACDETEAVGSGIHLDAVEQEDGLSASLDSCWAVAAEREDGVASLVPEMVVEGIAGISQHQGGSFLGCLL